MDVMHSCLCCLRCPPDKDLTSPYTHLGKTEIYADMLKECFDIHLESVGTCGICSACVGRLRDASDFKLQVQRSQAELQAALLVKVEPRVKSEVIVDAHHIPSFDVLHVELLKEPEMIKVEIEEIGEDPLIKPTTSDDVISDGNWTLAGTAVELLQPEGGPKTKLGIIKMLHTKKKRTKSIKNTHETTSIKNNYAKAHSHMVKPYTCDICGKQFKEKYHLGRHITTHMTKRDEYPCKICNKSLLSLYDLKRHKMIHTGEKCYTCEYCKLKFTQKGNLDRHRRIHTGEKPYVCEDCDKKFASKGNLERHRKLHTGDKPFKCEKCTKRFSKKKNWRIHKCKQL